MVWFTLVVDNFGVKYIGKEHFEYLISTLKTHYEITIDRAGEHYLGMKLEWNYIEKTVDISMPGYVSAALQRFRHPAPKQPIRSP